MLTIDFGADQIIQQKWTATTKGQIKGCLFELRGEKLEYVENSDVSGDNAWADFGLKLPTDDCRFGLYNFNYTVTSGASNVSEMGRQKAVLIKWVGNNTPMRKKMMAAAATTALKNKIGITEKTMDLFDHGDLELTEIAEQIKKLGQTIVTLESRTL